MKLLVVGGESLVGRALVVLLMKQTIEYQVMLASDAILLQKAELEKAISLFAPTLIINVANYAEPELAESDPDAARLCDELNVLMPTSLAEICRHLVIPLMQHSSSLVFDGAKVHPYAEEDIANPQCRYGVSQWHGEQAIRERVPTHIILRTDWVFSAESRQFFEHYIDECKNQQGRVAVIQNRFSPTPAADVARVLLAIAQQLDCGAEVWGTYHYCAQQPLSHEAFVEHILQEASRHDQKLAQELPNLQITKLPVHLPFIANSSLNGQRLFETFGIKARSRNAALSELQSLICKSGKDKVLH